MVWKMEGAVSGLAGGGRPPALPEKKRGVKASRGGLQGGGRRARVTAGSPVRPESLRRQLGRCGEWEREPREHFVNQQFPLLINVLNSL